MLRQFSTKRILGLFLMDWVGTLGVLFLAAFLRTELGSLPESLLDVGAAVGLNVGGTARTAELVGDLPLPVALPIMVALVWPCFLVLFDVYDGRRNSRLRDEARHVFLAICVSTLTVGGVLYMTFRETSRLLVVLFFALDVALLLGGRVVLWAYRRVRNGRVRGARRAVLVVGAGPVGRNAVEQLERCDWADIDLVGYVDDDADKQGQELDGLPMLGTLSEIADVVRDHDVQDAVVALPLRAHGELLRVCRTLQQLYVRVNVIPDLFVFSFPSATLDGFGGIPVIDLGQPGVCGWGRLVKRCFDAVAATLLLIAFGPLMALCALVIKLESPGPIIYKQQRVGGKGRLFTMLKFRSMRADSDPKVHKAHVERLIRENLTPEQVNGCAKSSLKMGDDPRITRVGKFIRKTSIDELPQLVNVVRGEMSLVGPRPSIPYEVDLYADWHRRRFEVSPGITGWYQVNGRNRVSFDEGVRMDIYYIEHMSFWLDLNILLRTPVAAISTKGAG